MKKNISTYIGIQPGKIIATCLISIDYIEKTFDFIYRKYNDFEKKNKMIYMKNYFLSISMLCLLFSGCIPEKKNESSLIEFNVSASYPEKEMKLEEVAEIEYLQLVVDENFLFSTDPSIITSEKIIFYESRTGDVMVYSRDGNPLLKFNR